MSPTEPIKEKGGNEIGEHVEAQEKLRTCLYLKMTIFLAKQF